MTHREPGDRAGRQFARVKGALLAAASAAIWISCATSTATAPDQASTTASVLSPAPPEIGVLEFLGEAVIPEDALVEGSPVGGLSGITYDPKREVYYAISDDPASRGPARFFTLTIDLADGSLTSEDVEALSLTRLLDRDGAPFAEMILDCEGIALSPDDTLYVSSEGQADQGVDPFLREVGLDGQHLRGLSLPDNFLPKPSKTRGIRHNLGFESATLTPSGRFFYSSTENALRQDGPEADVGVASPSRILRYERASGRLSAEFVYTVDPVGEAPPDPEAFRTRGLVELLALDDDHLLALERSYTQGVGNAVDLFLVSLGGASDVRKTKALLGYSYTPVQKTRLLELSGLGIELDNLEGMTLGPRLADGRRTLLVIADNNFNPRQRGQVLAFAIGEERPKISRIQGAGHRSDLEGAWVRGVRGTVTAGAARGPGFWVQGASDGDHDTSDALFVLPAEATALEPGTTVELAGWVRERGFPGALTVTSLEGALVEAGEHAPLPSPVTIESRAGGTGGRVLPSDRIDDDGLEVFSPDSDAIDFFESLEGMRVAVPASVVVGPTTRFGEFAVVAASGLEDGARLRSRAGGLIATASDLHPERFLVVSPDRSSAPRASVGDRFPEPIVGVLDYAFGGFRVLADEVPVPLSGGVEPETATLSSDRALAVATYNVENLSATSGPEKYARLARSIVENLGAPDILALQEIQDDTGPEDDGTVTAERTLLRLVEAITAAGGPRYEYCQIDPGNQADGGQPGANIRVAYLYLPDRVGFVSRGMPDAASEAELLVDEDGPFLSPNPARIGARHPAFSADPARSLTGVRKPLVAEFEVDGQRLFLVNVHLRSKRGDGSLFGGVQPPPRTSEPLRSEEARVVAGFVDRLLELDPAAAAMVVGDFNEHEYRDPVLLLLDSGLTNLVESVPAGDRYTYVYQGNSQVLDHVLVSTSLAGASPEIDIVHLNADFPDGSRASDHDPVLVRIRQAAAEDSESQHDS